MFAEDLFLINAVIDFCLLWCVKKILKKQTFLLRIVIGSFLGGVFAVFTYDNIFFIINLLIANIICIVSFGFVSPLEFLKTILCFLLASFVLAGAMNFVLSFFRVTEFPYFLFFITTAICFSILTYITKTHNAIQKQDIKEIEINIFDKKKKLKALRDTGNMTGSIIAEYDAIKELLPIDFCEKYEKDDEYYSLIGKYKFDVVPMQTISGTELLLAIPMGEEKIAITRGKLSNSNRFQAII